MYDIRSGYLQDAAIHSALYTRKDDEVLPPGRAPATSTNPHSIPTVQAPSPPSMLICIPDRKAKLSTC